MDDVRSAAYHSGPLGSDRRRSASTPSSRTTANGTTSTCRSA
jgi:hypothetical protein